MGTVISSGTKTVKSGETLDQPTITNSGTVVVSSGGIVTLAQIVNSGHEIVESGGVDSGSIIYDWGELILKNGGCAYSVDVYDNGYISATGGSVFSATIGSNGDVLLKGWSSGGSMVSGYISKVTIQHRWGELTLSSGGVASDVTMTKGDVTVFSGGYLQKTSLGRTSSSYYNSKMAQVNISEGQANLNYINWEGFVNVCSGGTATSNFVYSGGSILAKKDGLIYSTSVLGGTAILSGGTAADTTIDSGGTFEIAAGGRCSNTTVTSGNMNIYRGVASATTLINGRVSNCGESVSATYSGGSVYVNCGSSISEKLLGGQMTVSGGSSAGGDYSYVRDLTIQSATVYFYNSNYLEVATVSKGGELHINSGTRASSVDVMSGGKADIRSGAYLSGGSVYGSEHIGSGALVLGVNVMSGGSLGVYGGSANECTVAGGGSVTVTSSAAFTDGIVSAGVILKIESGGTATIKQTSGMSASIDDGMLTLNSGSADYAILKKGTVNISSGAYLGNTVVSAGTMTLYAGGSAGDVQLSKGSETRLNIQSGAVVDYAIVSGSSANLKISSGGILNLALIIGANTTVNGSINSCNLTSGGFLAVSSGGSVIRAELTSDSFLNIRDSGMASNVVVSKRGYVNVSSGGWLMETIINHSQGAVTVSDGGKCSNVTVVSGNMYVSSGGTATATALLDGGLFILGQSISGSFSSGNVTVSGGSSIKESLLGGAMYVYAAGGNVGYASGLHIKSATAGFFSGTTLAVAYVSAGGRLQICDGARASYVDVTDGGAVSIESGGFASDVTLRGGVVSCGDGARMDGDVSADGVARFLGGTTGGMTVSSGGILSITRNLAMDTGKITFGVGGSLDFDISDFSASSDTPLFGTKGGKGYDSYIANLANAACSLTVGDTQLLTEATYVLASEASTFNNTITVKYANAGVEFGTLTVGGTTRIGDMNFTLSRGADNALSVTVASATPTPTPSGPASADIDGNGISDVMFVWTGEHGEGNYQHGYWMNGTNEWQSANSGHPAEWENLGCYDMTGNGKADSVLFGNVTSEAGIKGAYIGFYTDAIDAPDGSTWVTIGYLDNAENITWQNKVCNLTGNADGVNSIIWYAPDLYALGVWKDGTTEWATISNTFGGSDWNLVGCGDFSGAGKDSVLMSYNNGQLYYVVGLDGAAPKALGNSDWRGWEIRAIGDFAGDGKDDIVLFHHDTGSMVMCADGKVDDFVSIGQLAANDWFVVGAGDYNGDAKDDLLVRQYSTGMLGYYVCADQSQWVEMGRGVGMEWTVIA